jgi:hypothetical protein
LGKAFARFAEVKNVGVRRSSRHPCEPEAVKCGEVILVVGGEDTQRRRWQCEDGAEVRM